MAKDNPKWVCSECGADHSRWAGQCSNCSSWNTIVEFKEAKLSPAAKATGKKAGYAGGTGTGALSLKEIPEHTEDRIFTNNGEFDRVCGGGVVIGSINLISGDPGAGKTTLLSQIIGAMSTLMPCLYVTAEESLSQFRNRFSYRLKVPHNEANMKLMSESNVDVICETAISLGIKFMVVDSIQSVYGDEFSGAAGSVSQVKGCAQTLTTLAKQKGITIFIVGHVTKNNEVAGPKTLDHIVDALFHIETNDGDLRLMRPSKNRFGDVETIGLFKMMERGMVSVDNPSRIFLSGSETPSSGSAVTCVRDGSRNLLLEVQSLVTASENDNVQRVCIGLNMNRLKLVGAVLRKHGKIKLNHDIYTSLIGGLKLPETDASADLALAASIYSSFKEVVLDKNSCFIGELSLAGEVRPVSGGNHRASEAIKHGFTNIYLPKANYSPKMDTPGITFHPLTTIAQLIAMLG
jgi:DNA repair protein RadA/Sms